MKKLLVTMLTLGGRSVGGVARFDHLATRPVDPAEFSWFNKAEIYTGNLAMMIAGVGLRASLVSLAEFCTLPRTGLYTNTN